ncbi:hypothetical protein RDI58_004777 [Solanum bulbocastanum]|uniref:Uncharacterized protein n=1 Tax=Solanum bulbocastanum TaxID=147425 RepID=A0AAN8U6I6_SOLBU
MVAMRIYDQVTKVVPAVRNLLVQLRVFQEYQR